MILRLRRCSGRSSAMAGATSADGGTDICESGPHCNTVTGHGFGFDLGRESLLEQEWDGPLSVPMIVAVSLADAPEPYAGLGWRMPVRRSLDHQRGPLAPSAVDAVGDSVGLQSGFCSGRRPGGG